jgi:hypothetical protein
MAGFREFVTGEVLTAANVDDFLAKQAVMKFADAAARDTALGTAVASGNALREGMVAYLDDEDAPSFYDGSAWGPISVPLAGIGSNVVQVVKTNTFSASLATGAISGDVMTASITPTSATAKVLVVMQVSAASDAGNGYVYVYKNGSPSDFRGDAEGSNRRRVATGIGARVSGTRSTGSSIIAWLDSPATTSSVTYSFRVGHAATGTETVFCNRGNPDDDNVATGRSVSSITLIEVAA